MIYQIRVLVEASEEEVDELREKVADLVCNSPHNSPAEPCRWRWFVASRPLDPDEAAEWDSVLNE